MLPTLLKSSKREREFDEILDVESNASGDTLSASPGPGGLLQGETFWSPDRGARSGRNHRGGSDTFGENHGMMRPTMMLLHLTTVSLQAMRTMHLQPQITIVCPSFSNAWAFSTRITYLPTRPSVLCFPLWRSNKCGWGSGE